MSSTTALPSCVSTLRTSLALLDSSINILDSGVHDFPRLAKVLSTTRHFELVPESHLQSAQSSILSEITPEVSNLLNRVEGYLERLGRREEGLRAKAELQEGRLGGGAGRPSGAATRGKSLGGSGALLGEGRGGQKEVRMHMLSQKKERLAYAVERLELQAKQRERQLRMSVAAQ